MFDTFIASKMLSLPGCSLAYLLKTFCNFITDKKFQLSDWRKRPLPIEMLKYAICDTHFLLEIYDKLKEKLIEIGKTKFPKNQYHFLQKCYENSKKISLSMYEKPQLFENTENEQIIENHRLLLKKSQMSVLKGLLKWRDFVARKEDESIWFTCQNNILFTIMRQCPVFL